MSSARPASESASKRLDNVWFYEVHNDGYDPDKIAGGGRCVETHRIRTTLLRIVAQWKSLQGRTVLKPLASRPNTLLPHSSEETSCWWTTKERLGEADYNLGAGQWKPRVAEKVSEADPRELVAEVLADYRKVVAGLDRLLEELAE